MIKHLPKSIQKSARHITRAAGNKAHTPCEKCQPFTKYSKKEILNGIKEISYNGLPVKLRSYVPKNEIWFVDNKGRITALNIKTGKVRTLKKNPYESPIF